jgi:hypothetical protein
VDSGHTCLQGFNEVVILRPLPEKHKIKACSLLPVGKGEPTLKGKEVLYTLPHAGQSGDELKKHFWPTSETVAAWKDLQ